MVATHLNTPKDTEVPETIGYFSHPLEHPRLPQAERDVLAAHIASIDGVTLMRAYQNISVMLNSHCCDPATNAPLDSSAANESESITDSPGEPVASPAPRTLSTALRTHCRW